jgi:hypothetical protein
MGRLSKSFSLLIILILAISSLIMVKPTFAQTIPEPSIPEFNVKCVYSSYNVATIDLYTGINTTEQINNSTIQVIIKNQHYSYSDNNTTYLLYYNVRWKPHFGETWSERFPVINRPNARPPTADSKDWSMSKYLTAETVRPLPESQSNYTVTSYAVNSFGRSTPSTIIIFGGNATSYATDYFSELPPNAQIDFQVEAIVGYNSQAWYIQHPFTPEHGGFYEPAIAYYSDTGWSDTQTITLSNPPKISFISPQVENYTVSDVPLNFTVDNPISQIAYSLDAKENVTVAGNTTLTGLSNGVHNITVYVNDTYGGTGKSETISFTVAVPEPPQSEKETFPTTLATVSTVVLVGAVGVGLIVYFKKRKRHTL